MNLLHMALALVLSLSRGYVMEDTAETIRDIVDVVIDGPLINESEEDTVRLLVVMAYRESAFRATIEGDHGNSIGLLQINKRWASPEELRDRKKNLRIGLDLLISLVNKCGSTKAGLGAYMTGYCGGAPRKTTYRCLAAGLGANCKGEE